MAKALQSRTKSTPAASKRGSARTQNLTRGPILSQMILFALPLLGTNLIMLLYSTANLAFAGHFIGTQGSAAIGSSVGAVFCLVSFFIGLGMGASVVAALQFSSGNFEKLSRTIHSGVVLGVLGGGGIAVVGIIFAPALLHLLNVNDAIFGQSLLYVRIYFISVVPMVTYNIIAGIIRALGNSFAPMLYQLVGGLANIAMDALLLGVVGTGVEGCAIASVIAQSAAVLLGIRHLTRLDPAYRLHANLLRLHRAETVEILRIGVPAGIQSMVISLSNVVIQSQINLLGVTAISAFAAFSQVEVLMYYPVQAMGQASMIFTSQNIGDGQGQRARRGLRVAMGSGLVGWAVTCALLLLFAHPIFTVFSTDEDVIALATQIAFVVYPSYALYVFTEIPADTIRGVGESFRPMLISVLNMCVLRIVLLFVFESFIEGWLAIVLIYPVSWVASMACMMVYYRFGRWRENVGWGIDRPAAEKASV